MVRSIDDVVIWLEEDRGGFIVPARSRSRIDRSELGQNRRHPLDLFRIIDVLRRPE